MALQPSPRVPALDPYRLMATIDRQVKRIGMIATLRRDTGDRQCWMFFGAWNPIELMGHLENLTDRLAIISAAGLTDPPTHTKDRLITFVQPDGTVEDENLRILSVAERIAPGGVVIAWKLRVRR
jgi:hypothetical protein